MTEVGEGVTHGQMPTNYSVMLSRARPRMPDSGRASLSLSTNVRELPKPVMTQPAPPRAQAATPPYRISPLGGRGGVGNRIKDEKLNQRSPLSMTEVSKPRSFCGSGRRRRAGRQADGGSCSQDRRPYLVGGLRRHGGWRLGLEGVLGYEA